ncbi:hypothetical protein BaRGS_00030440 [Batillaria attramentaria]|uniref:Uncharacterized protein n=1 Tax=Batillaria attramentaria TaxID=370345 RepID=A0ABD0JUT3_9CAEN
MKILVTPQSNCANDFLPTASHCLSVAVRMRHIRFSEPDRRSSANAGDQRYICCVHKQAASCQVGTIGRLAKEHDRRVQ